MARINHLLVLGLAVLMVAQSYANLHYDGAYVYMTNHPKHMDHPVYVNNAIGPEAKSTNYETRFNGDVCYNLTNYVLEDKGSLGNHRWVEVTFGEDCVAGLIIEEHKMTEEEPFSACYTFQYKRYMYFGDHERPPTCTPAMYEYHVIFTLSKDPDENVKQMIVQRLSSMNKYENFLHILGEELCSCL
nr:uncharacterized protein LOC105326470 isoform X1 [Crassostrea gigas]